jgi:hypothetical protein
MPRPPAKKGKKFCHSCATWLDRNDKEFPVVKSNNGKRYLTSPCRLCRGITSSLWQKENPEHAQRNARTWRKRKYATDAEWRAKQKARWDAWYAEHGVDYNVNRKRKREAAKVAA